VSSRGGFYSLSGYSGEEKALLPVQRITFELPSGPDPANIAYNMFCLVHSVEKLL